MAENWIKYDVRIGIYLKTGVITKDEFTLLSYMLNQCDRNSGIIFTNSRLLSIELDAGRKWVSNLLSSLKKKGHIQNPAGKQFNLRQKRGNTKPYAILLCDALPVGEKDRGQTEARQRPDRGQTDGPDRTIEQDAITAAESLSLGESGNFLAKTETDLDIKIQQPVVVDNSSSETEIDKLTNILQNINPVSDNTNREKITNLLKEYSAEYVLEKLEMLKVAPNVDSPTGWLIQACRTNYQPSKGAVEAKRLEEQRKANIEIAATERAERQIRDDAIQAEREEMETFKAAMAPTERNELHQQALSQLGVMDNGMPMPDRAIIERENAIIKANNPNVLS